MASQSSNQPTHRKVMDKEPRNEEHRLSFLRSARTLVNSLETPKERVLRMCYHHSSIFMATKVLTDLDIFEHLASADEPVAACQMADALGVSCTLLSRLLKHVAIECYVNEVGPDTYAANEVTLCIATPPGRGAIKNMFPSLHILAAMPEFLRENNYDNPSDKDKSAWKYAYKTDQHYFDYISSSGHEQWLVAFNNHMEFKTLGLKWYEQREILEAIFPDEIGPDDVLLVDVGGNNGRDLLGFHQAHHHIPGRLILQDLPSIVEALNCNRLHCITPLAHDFFTPQPIYGAKAYYLKMILHDWPNPQAIQILKQLKPALKLGHSRILLNEIVIPDERADWFETSVDMVMMQFHSAHERGESEWNDLISQVGGLRIKHIWHVEGAVEKLIEIEAI